MKHLRHMIGDETGAAALELLFAIPLVMLFGAGILDLGTYIERNIALDMAATAAVRYCMDDPSRADNTESIKEYLSVVEPNLGDVSLRLTRQPACKQAYNHLFYIDESETAIARKSYCSYQPLSVEVSYQGQFKTLVGRGISIACGGNGSLKARNVKSGLLDMTDGDTW